MANGSVALEIIQTPHIPEMTSESSTETSHPSELEMPQLPYRPIIDYGTNIRNIHQTALNIIKLQEAVKRHGQLSQADETEYRENLDSLNIAAENLAKLQDNEDEDLINIRDRQGLSPWFERKKTNKIDKDKKKEEEKRKEEERKRKEEAKRKEEEEKKKEEEEKKKEEVMEKEEKKKKEEAEKAKLEKEKEEQKEKEKEKEGEKEEEEEEEEEEENDAIAVNLPPEDASVAEAKPVGLAIAGIGGVASSKPIATAVVGPGGLAVARPVGTAIAGVSPDQSLVPVYAEEEEAPSKKKGQKGQNKEEKKKIGTSEYLNRIISRYHQV